MRREPCWPPAVIECRAGAAQVRLDSPQASVQQLQAFGISRGFAWVLPASHQEFVRRFGEAALKQMPTADLLAALLVGAGTTKK